MAVAVLAMTFADLLSDALRSRKQSRNAFARDLGVAPSSVTRYLQGDRPEYTVCQRFAALMKLPESLVLQAAGLMSAPEGPAHDPPWLSKLIAEMRELDLTPREADVLDATVQGLRALREERKGYVASPPEAPEPPPPA